MPSPSNQSHPCFIFALSHTTLRNNVYRVRAESDRKKCKKGKRKKRGDKVGTTQTNCKTCAILHSQYFVWLFAVRGKVLVLYTHAFICCFFFLSRFILVFVVVFFSTIRLLCAYWLLIRFAMNTNRI